MQHEVNGFFNPRNEGDTFKGLNGSIAGTVAPTVIQDLPTFLETAGRNYYIKKVAAVHPLRLDQGVDDRAVGNQFFLCRSDTGAIVSPKTVSEQYAPMSLLDVATELQPFCDQGWATPDGVYGGRFLEDGGESLEVLSMRLDAGGIDFPEGERFVHYMVITNPHGTGGKAQGKIISWRIVCCNTFAAAVSAGYDFSISHRVAKDADPQTIMAERMAEAVSTWDNAKQKIAALAERVNAWQGIKIGEADALHLTDTLLGIAGKETDKISTRATNKRDAIMAGFSSRDAGTIGESVYDWLNAVTFFTSSPEANKSSKVAPVDRMIRNIDPQGSGFELERKAKKLAESLA